MKLVRLVALLSAAAAPSFVFAAGVTAGLTPATLGTPRPAVAPVVGAADSASNNGRNSVRADGLTGTASITVDGVVRPLAAGEAIPAGASVEVFSGSSVTLTLANGTKVVLGPNTRVRLQSVLVPATGLYSFEVLLVRGSITADATGAVAGSSFTVRTASGKADVAGTSFKAEFSPSAASSGTNGGVFDVTSAKGTVEVTPVSGSGTVSVPAGSQVTVGQPGQTTPQVRPAGSQSLNSINSTNAQAQSSTPARGQDGSSTGGSGSTGSEAGSDKPADSKTDSSVNQDSTPGVNIPNLGMISPNGEGAGL